MEQHQRLAHADQRILYRGENAAKTRHNVIPQGSGEMNLLDRYLQSVRRHLPLEHREDIIRELTDNLRSQIEDKEAVLGRPLEESEQEDLLKQHGQPLIVASRYQPDQRSLAFGRQLIGPVLFPFYVRVLSLTVSLAFIVISLIVIGLLIAGQSLRFTTVVEVYVIHLLVQFTIITLIFTSAQTHLTRYPEQWDPRHPNRLQTAGAAARSADVRVSRFESVAQIVFLFMMGAWIEALGNSTDLLTSLGANGIAPGPVWHRIFIPLLAVPLAGIVQSLINLVRPDWTWLRSLYHLGSGIAWLAILIVLLVAGDWVIATGEARDEVLSAVASFNLWFYYSLVACTILSAGIIAFDNRKLPRELRKLSVASLGIAVLLLAAQPAECQSPKPETPPAPRVGHAVRSPEVHADGRVTFRFHAPNAGKVVVLREGGERLNMVKNDRGTWSVTTETLSPDLYVYTFLVDGVALADPANPLRKAIVTGGNESIVHVPGPPSLSWELNNVPQGTIHRHRHHSSKIGEPREYFVYTPPGYDPTAKLAYPVLYLFHGVMDDASAWSSVGRLDVILDNLIARGKVRPMLVVMPLGYGFPNAPDRVGEQFGGARLQRTFLNAMSDYLLDELMPLVEQQYRVSKMRSDIAIAGLSMGGTQSLYIALNHPDRFGRVGAFSSALVMFSGSFETWFPDLAKKENTNLPELWISCGTTDFLLKVNRTFKDWLKKNDIRYTSIETPGGHVWPVWRRNLEEFTCFAFPAKSADKHP
jgi:enterochelin esterase family protein